MSDTSKNILQVEMTSGDKVDWSDARFENYRNSLEKVAVRSIFDDKDTFATNKACWQVSAYGFGITRMSQEELLRSAITQARLDYFQSGGWTVVEPARIEYSENPDKGDSSSSA